VVAYSADREAYFFESLLSDANFASGNPFIRLSLAKRVGTPGVVLPELRRSAAHLFKKSPDFVSLWYSKERPIIAAMLAEYDVDLPVDVQQYLRPRVTLTKRRLAFEKKVAQLCAVMGDSCVATRHNLSHDLYFETPDPTGRSIRTFVECKSTSSPVDGDLVDRSAQIWLREHGEHPLQRYWIVSAAGFTHTAKDKAQEHGIELLTLDNLISKSNRMCSSFFVEERSAIFGRKGRYAFFAHRSDQPLDSVKATAAYVDVVESQKVLSGQLLVVLDFAGWKGDFPDVTRDSLHSAHAQALLRYQNSWSRVRKILEADEPGPATVWRNYLISPECLTDEGRGNLHRVLTWHVRARLNVALCYAGTEMTERLVMLSANIRRKLLAEASTGNPTLTTRVDSLQRETQGLLRSATEIMVSEGNEIVADRVITTERDVGDAIAELAELAA
jgi:hypothetical protein